MTERLASRGLRSTSQREHVYDVLLQERDHPTAEQVFMRTKKALPDISMATVYNCLDALVKAGWFGGQLDPHGRRLCPNMLEHHHFYCDECGGTYDIDLLPDAPQPAVPVPNGFKPNRYEITIRGSCPRCNAHKRK